MLYSDIEARVLKNINSTTADVSVAIDNAIDFLGNFYDIDKIDSSKSTVINQDYIALPDRCKEVKKVEINGVDYPQAIFKKLEEIKDYELSKFFEYDGKIKLIPTPASVVTTKIYYKSFFTPLAGVAGATTDVPQNLIPLLISVATWFFFEQTENMYDYTGSDGWIGVNNAWSFLSDTDAPTFTITVPSGATSRYQAGMRIKLTQTTKKYFIVTKVTDTVLTVYGGTDYTLTNAIISQIYFSTAKCPFGFPTDPTKWTVLVTDVVERAQNNPTAGTWYNVGSLSITLPIGLWEVSYELMMYVLRSGAGNIDAKATLSTNTNGETDPELSNNVRMTFNLALQFNQQMTTRKILDITAETIYYMNITEAEFTVDTIALANSRKKFVLQAVCKYL